MSDIRYRSKPSEIEAIQWTGENLFEVIEFADRKVGFEDGGLTLLAGKDGAQGWVPVSVGHWVVSNPGDKTDLWPVDPDYFAGKYEAVRP